MKIHFVYTFKFLKISIHKYDHFYLGILFKFMLCYLYTKKKGRREQKNARNLVILTLKSMECTGINIKFKPQYKINEKL